ncbi:MAG TPA: hypothetical protein VNT79_10250 [Phycisphaerae bacterium]|nr:hypothetical protein [Phycisphaerae bacterium]
MSSVFSIKPRTLSCISIALGIGATHPGWVQAGSTVAGERYQVICDFDDDAIARSALEAAEAAWPVVTELFGVETDKSTQRLQIHIYRQIADYQTAEAQRTGGRFRDNLCFSSHEDKSSHIAIQPPCSDDVLMRIGLPGLTRMLVAHEAAHLAVYSTIPNFESHPEWLAEGYALYAAAEVHRRKKWASSTGDNPYLSSMVKSAQQTNAGRNAPSISRIVAGKCQSLATNDRYALYWLLFEFLLNDKEDGPKFRKFLGKSRRLGGGSEYAVQLGKVFRKEIGAGGKLTGADAKFKKYVKDLPARWSEQFRSLDVQKAKWIQCAFPDSHALAWSTRSIKAESFRINGAFEILPSGDGEKLMHVMLGKAGSQFIFVSFTSTGRVIVRQVFWSENRSDFLADVKTPIAEGKRTKFSIAVKGDVLTVFLEGKQIARCNARGKKLTGPWGVGVEKGCAGIWREVKVLSKVARKKSSRKPK